MLESMKSWIVTILIGAFIANIVDMVLPSSKIKPYINLVVNFIFVFIVLTPIINFFSKDISLEDKILKSMSEYNKEYVDSINELADKTGNNSLSKGYEDGLKEVLKLKLNEYGYELDDIQFDGNKIEKITVKDKNNSNKNENEDIQSKENENSQQVFNEKDKEQSSEYSIDLNEDKLKEDLVEILDVSIESIQID
ncbi:stage III sporulation protein AF [Romboutsia sp. 13368]|uniref:stage III sporulation protein AF n=1 Tax=Romboutsia sp. 13368 TaxID=2708053 RepID=UPI0025D23AB7|nr:stage III sporulation protein AF [Romboutsia sp. 13368]